MSGIPDTERLTVVDHPVTLDGLTRLRDHRSSPPEFREATRRISRVLAVYGGASLPLGRTRVTSPTGMAASCAVVEGRIVLIPIMRAGLGMVDGFLDILPMADIGFLGLARNEESLQPEEYYRKFPKDPANASVFILDPMLGTGGSICAALRSIGDVEPARVTVVSIISAPEGINTVHSSFPDIRIITAAVDERLNDRGFIVPGLGDAGDRLWGTE